MFDQNFDDFMGGVFSEQIDGGRASAQITLGERGIVARTERGQTFIIPYADCQLEIGGASGRMVFCRLPDRSLTIFCEDKRFPAALAQLRWAGLDTQVELILTKGRRERSRSRAYVIIGSVVLLAVLVGGYFGLKAAARTAVRAAPISIDQKIGKLAINSMEMEGPDLEDEVVTQAIEAIVAQLADTAAVDGLEFEVHIIDAPMVNAFALPGGQIVVHTGLIEKCTEPEQLAGVLAHEMAHVTLRHGLERISQTIGLAAAANIFFGDVEGVAVVGVELMEMATVNSYSREQEAEADAEGVRLMYQAGWDPDGMARFFEVLHQEHGDAPEVPAWMSTHPKHEERIDAIHHQLKGLPVKQQRLIAEELDVDWQDILKRVRKE